jgi:predicted nucleic acid-binding protein
MRIRWTEQAVDPDDDMFLAAALAASTRIIESGDKHLLRVSGWLGIEIL